MSLETVVFNFNEAMFQYGLQGNLTVSKLIMSDIFIVILLIYFLSNDKFIALIDKFLTPETMIMFSWILIFDMLIMKSAYTLILILLGVFGCLYILFTNKRYQKHKDLLIHLIERLF